VKILWDSGNVGFGGCGINEWDRNVIDSLREQGHDVTLIVDDLLARRPKFKKWTPPKEGFLRVREKLTFDNYKEFVDSLGTFDVQIGNHFTMYPVLDRVVPICHDYDLGVWLDPGNRVKLMARGLSKIVSGFVCTTPFIENQINEVFPEIATASVYGGTKFKGKQQANKEKPYIAYWGNRYGAGKNFNNLLKTLPYHNFDLKVCGFLPPNNSELQLVEKLNVNHRVEFFTGLNNEELQKMITGASLYVCPSKYEGFGLPVVEAMSMGVPVVAAPYASLPLIVGDCGRVAKSGSAKDLAHEILQVVAEPEETEAKRKKAFSKVEPWTWENTASSIVSFCQKVLK
jgi:glycosyltransferase involved in cell wall biosynthesis